MQPLVRRGTAFSEVNVYFYGMCRTALVSPHLHPPCTSSMQGTISSSYRQHFLEEIKLSPVTHFYHNIYLLICVQVFV
jgi:hypothetical protein